jgi:hypothetical protein
MLGGVTADVAMKQASAIMEETAGMGFSFLHAMGMDDIAEEMRNRAEVLPSRAWVNTFLLGDPDLVLKSPEAIEGQRFLFGTTALIKRWLDDFEETLTGVEPDFIFNADESMLSVTRKQGKVIVEREKTAFMQTAKKGEHITGMFCCNAAGIGPPPLFLFPDLKNIPRPVQRHRDLGHAWLDDEDDVL